MLVDQLIDTYQDKIIIFYKQHHRMPTYSELQKLTHYRSKGGVSKLVDKLEQMQFLYRDNKGRLIPGFSFYSIPFPGSVQAGFPSSENESYCNQDKIDLYTLLIKDPNNAYIHTVSGDSMIEAGIFNGDLVISEKTNDMPIGKIVIAQVNGSCTIKRLMKDSEGTIYLKPENSEHSNIYSEEGQEIIVLATVKSVIRQFDKQQTLSEQS